MNIPDKINYTKEHEWCIVKDDIATIGITDFAQSELGDIVFVEFPEIDNEIKKDDAVGTIEAVKTVADIYSPLSGKIIEVNTSLEDEPNLINDDPYKSGWIFKLKIIDMNEKDSLLNSNEYKDLIE